MPASPARPLAAALVNAVLIEGRSLSSRSMGRPGIDSSAAQGLAWGTLRMAGRLNLYLDTLAERALDPPELRGALLVGLFELHSAASPAYAVIHDTVEGVARQAPRARGFANAILRAYTRRRDELERLAQADPVARWNLPQWWLARLQADHPQHWQAICQAQDAAPPMTLRVNRRRTDPAAYVALLQAAGLGPRITGADAITLAQPVPVAQLPHYAEGWVSVQDLGAQSAARLLAAEPGMRVLDACAAPGGKTAHLLEMNDLDLLALDQDPQRVAQLDHHLRRLGLHARVRAADAGAPAGWWDGRPFQRILLDAPCSGSGVIRRHPDARWLKRAEDLQHLVQQQARLLDALWPLLAPGGTMLYATCSLFAAENQAQTASFLARHADARPDPAPHLHSQDATHLLLPGAEADGFFYARLRKG